MKVTTKHFQGDSGGALTVDGVLVGLVSRGGSVAWDCAEVTCFSRFNLDLLFRRMSLTSTLRWPPLSAGSMKLFWEWEACTPVTSYWRKLPMKV